MLRGLIGVALILSFAGSIRAADSPLGRQVENFQLQDYRGKEHALTDYRDSKLVVIAFLGTECPLAKLYGPRLAKLAADYHARRATTK